jgi:N-acetylglucosamine kinase-like BadF-type ATPase
MQATGATSEIDLLEGLYLGQYSLSPSAAPLVFRAAAEGDAVAQEIVRWAGRELGDLALGVIRQLDFQELGFDVVLAGSLYGGSPLLVEAMQQTIHAEAPGARLVRLAAPPVVGGVLLGMEQVGIKTFRLRQPLMESTQRLR